MSSLVARSPQCDDSDLTEQALPGLAHNYLRAKEYVLSAGYAWEIDWQHERALSKVNERDFICQAAWVVLCSGMRESVIRGCFGKFSKAFYNWESAKRIALNKQACYERGMTVFKHPSKVHAIIDIARHIHRVGFAHFSQSLQNSPLDHLQKLPYIGPITSFHLAKNIGIPVAKPDRHLTRLAKVTGFDSAGALCQAVSAFLGEPIQVVDIVLWRFATLQSNYLEWFVHSRPVIGVHQRGPVQLLHWPKANPAEHTYPHHHGFWSRLKEHFNGLWAKRNSQPV